MVDEARAYEASESDLGFDRALVAICAVVAVAATMTILDSTIVNIALTVLSEEWRTPLSTVQWVAAAYLLALSTVIPLTGWLTHRWGAKRVFVYALVLFVVGSALCAAAWSAASLIVFRVVQGLGGGLILPVAMIILVEAAGPNRQGKAMSAAGAPMLLGPILGPLLGGLLIDSAGWRWIFLINVPLGLIAVLAAAWVLPAGRAGNPEREIDTAGLVLLSGSAGLLVYALSKAGGLGEFTDPHVYLPLVGGATLATAVVGRWMRDGSAILDLSMFRSAAVSLAAGIQFLFAIAFFGLMMLIPLYLQVVRDFSALFTGVMVVPYGVGAAIAMPMTGAIADRSGARNVTVAGLVLLLVGSASLCFIGADTPLLLLGAAQFVLGVGMAGTMVPSMTAAYQHLPPGQVLDATSLFNVISRIGGAVGVAVLSVVLIGGAGAEGDRRTASRLSDLLSSDSSTEALHGFRQGFAFASVLVFAALVLACLLPKGKPTHPAVSE
ncbi:DHA2 family efflux MFS transporter permease subunit [Nocardia uniformis]|uniref:DHA2 family efflux MFS transporter permease subunit n=1 Tax=Nocardia uniformis TaxID=53432 RepID=A0A849CFU8_9NOCA|nr:DHA2 family efflux MFS transporter permease subunit [Nocardia uniformis]NNH75655.1 DHA2 family efflux MFS transporter permease subunit [Nocardia uniformis]